MIHLIKKIIKFGIAIIIYPIFFIVNHISFRTIFNKKIRRIFDTFRTSLMKLIGAKIGTNVYISKNFFSTSFVNLKFGNNGTIGMNCQLYSYGNGIEIGDNFLIGSNFVIHTSEHNFQNANLPIIEQGCSYKKVKIGNNVYIGSNVSILSGVRIDDNIIIATGSVVTKNLESGWIYGGIPAKKIKLIHEKENN